MTVGKLLIFSKRKKTVDTLFVLGIPELCILSLFRSVGVTADVMEKKLAGKLRTRNFAISWSLNSNYSHWFVWKRQHCTTYIFYGRIFYVKCKSSFLVCLRYNSFIATVPEVQKYRLLLGWRRFRLLTRYSEFGTVAENRIHYESTTNHSVACGPVPLPLRPLLSSESAGSPRTLPITPDPISRFLTRHTHEGKHI